MHPMPSSRQFYSIALDAPFQNKIRCSKFWSVIVADALKASTKFQPQGLDISSPKLRMQLVHFVRDQIVDGNLKNLVR